MGKCKKCKRPVSFDTWERLAHLFKYHRKYAIERLPRLALDGRIDAITKAKILAMAWFGI